MTVEDLRELAEKEQARQAQYEHRILYCSSAGCVSSGCDAVKNELKKAIGELDISKKCEMIGTGCLGLCGEGPLVFVPSGPTLYQHVDAAAARRIVEEHIGQGKKVKEN
jgi:(2Fe-2S) ferredoxin